MPPKVAPIQVVIIPISKNQNEKSKIESYLESPISALKLSGIRVHVDWTNSTPGFKFNEWEMKGVPLRMEVGPRDIKNNQVVIARRDLGGKIFLPKKDILSEVPKLLSIIQNSLFSQAKKFRDDNTFSVSSYQEFCSIIETGGFVRCGWNGSPKTELKIKENTKATIRCIPLMKTRTVRIVSCLANLLSMK